MTFKVKPMHKVAGDSQSCNKILSDHAPCECTPALPAAVARATRGQSTCFSVHTWEGGRFQGTETRYLTVIIPEVPSVISGTEIIDFLFFRKWLRGQEYPLHFPWLSLVLHIFFKRKINLKRSSYSAGQWSNTAGQGTRQGRRLWHLPLDDHHRCPLSQIGTGGSSFYSPVPPECQGSPHLFAGML